MEQAEEGLKQFGVVKSTTTGRIRLQLRPEYRTPEAIAKVRASLEEDERISEVTINERTGSITLKYSAEHHGHSLLYSAIQEAELVGEAAFDLPEDEEEESAGGGGGTYGKLDQQAADLMVKIDRAIYRRSGGKIHTRGRVFPLAIAGLGVAQMAIYGISLEMLPGPLLIWLAHDIHRRFSREHEEMVEEETRIKSGDAQAETGSPSLAAGALAAATA
ncbi:MAG: hypothetical protein R2844_07670 [Caldilineales bacterium]